VIPLVLFNYRYNPVHWKVEEVVASGAIGNVKSVHFEWLLVSGQLTLTSTFIS
jgi:predicted dehydrogenase